MRISLVGYMGSGKSAIGAYLFNKTNIPFIDLDDYIEEKEGESISEIFKDKGEIYFRKRENHYLKEILQKEQFILATGGGTPIFYDSMEDINAYSTSFYLQCSPILLAERLSKEKAKRPLISHLKDEDLVEFIAKHLFERNPFYQQSDYMIASQNKSVEEIGNLIIDLTKNHQNLT